MKECCFFPRCHRWILRWRWLLLSLLLVILLSQAAALVSRPPLPPTTRTVATSFGRFHASKRRPNYDEIDSSQDLLKETDDGGRPLVKTIGGGSSLIFEMARRMMVWDDEDQQVTNAAAGESSSSPSSASLRKQITGGGGVLPRWHPHAGISDVNPSFRTTSPIMNNQGYAGIIWRNVRKRDKPSLWRYALRTYNRMKELEQRDSDSRESILKIERTNVHHEGALLACDKLGLWQEALDIYRHVEETATTNQTVVATTRRRKAVCVTDNMILSLVSACVRGCRQLDRRTTSLSKRRAPLDAATQVLAEMEDKHGLPLVARHLNPLAAAYQSIGLNADASKLLQAHLTDRTSGPEEENGDDPFNVNDVRAKDKGSYALLVKGAVSTGDWADAVEALKEMTEAGLYPNARHLNRWTEVSESKRKAQNWKKKREEYWLESVR